MMYCDAVSYLPGDILCKVDRAAMAHGLEVRIPFLDHRVAEAAARIPLAMKVRKASGKHILKADALFSMCRASCSIARRPGSAFRSGRGSRAR